MERFTKEQEEALQLLTTLERIAFLSCNKLQHLAAGLHRLSNLKRLDISNCAAIRSLPKDGLPSSLQELEIDSCPAIRSMPKECLPSSLQKLVIRHCPAIRSLPKMLIQAGFWHCTSQHKFTTRFLEQLQSTDVPTLKCFLLLDDLAAFSVVCSCSHLSLLNL